ncbi:hypothetical protein X777_15901 [Ooceraea biroi]|uniref:Uncharacterized protein n=1 Tax=Ooceraea biroi TaxID=2015173 RepID=A0A026WTH7_OOCBI|nr:hypothetical protein X777_15901 [Ooceraea biroi]
MHKVHVSLQGMARYKWGVQEYGNHNQFLAIRILSCLRLRAAASSFPSHAT